MRKDLYTCFKRSQRQHFLAFNSENTMSIPKTLRKTRDTPFRNFDRFQKRRGRGFFLEVKDGPFHRMVTMVDGG